MNAEQAESKPWRSRRYLFSASLITIAINRGGAPNTVILSRNDAVGNRKTCSVVAATPSSQEVLAAPPPRRRFGRMAHVSVSKRYWRRGRRQHHLRRGRRSYYGRRSLSANCIVTAEAG